MKEGLYSEWHRLNRVNCFKSEGAAGSEATVSFYYWSDLNTTTPITDHSASNLTRVLFRISHLLLWR
jgi:hypothetical protein